MKNKVWLLKRREEFNDWSILPSPWNPWYGKCTGMVVVAENESCARAIAARCCGGEDGDGEGPEAWLLDKWSTCVEIDIETENCVLTDVHEA